MPDAVKVGLVPFSTAARGVLVVFSDESLKFGPVSRKALGAAADQARAQRVLARRGYEDPLRLGHLLGDVREFEVNVRIVSATLARGLEVGWLAACLE